MSVLSGEDHSLRLQVIRKPLCGQLIIVMEKEKQRKPFFAKKGNSEEYNYTEHQVIFIAVAAAIVLAIIVFVRTGAYGFIKGLFS